MASAPSTKAVYRMVAPDPYVEMRSVKTMKRQNLALPIVLVVTEHVGTMKRQNLALPIARNQPTLRAQEYA